MRFLRAALLVCSVAVAASSCGGDDDPAGPGQGNGFFRARVNNAAWEGEVLASAAVRTSPAMYTITAIQTAANGFGISLSMYNVRETGVAYTLGMLPTMTGGTAIVSQPPASGWATLSNGAAGTVTFTTLSDTRVAGTFSFTATALTGSGTISVTNGEFDLPLTAFGAAGPIPENAGGRFSGTIGGSAFNAAGAGVNLVTGSSPTLVIVGTNIERSVTLTVANMTGAATYALSTTTPVRSIQVSGLPGNPSASWGSQVAGGTGSVTITSVTAARVQGSFTATLAPLGGGATGTLAVSGTFDLGRP